METNIKNNLWQARQRSGLERKQVGFLLSKKSIDEISRYERGVYLPSLKTALKFEIIYQTPVRLLFQELFEQSRREISEIKERQANSLPGDRWFVKDAEQLKQEEFCFYAELLKSRVPSSPELEAVTKHTIALINAVSDYKQGRKPFSA
ncbi:MAG: helix-turn-helix transcriptional regulator [Acidobacteria bacterium]|nr:helix-turn-helix transcriptional regulator [Acidobacteriota bacterium]MCA1637091.1 helix-turn-helix transcriptional regulator [Acidobacteriota bacterium]